MSTPQTIIAFPPSRWAMPLRRMRRMLARENLKDLAGTLGIVAVLTVLIWVWAEREQVIDKQVTPFTLALRSERDDRIVTVIQDRASKPDESRSLDTVRIPAFTVKGPNARVDALDRLLRSSNTLVVSLGDNIPLDTAQNIDIAPLIAELPELRELGLSVVSVDPREVRVIVDNVLTKEVPVVPQKTKPGLSISFSPPVVTVRGPQRELEQKELQGVLAQLTDAQLEQGEVELAVVEDPPLTVPPSTQIQIVGDPEITATIKPPENPTVEFNISAVPFSFLKHSRIESQFAVTATLNGQIIPGTIPNVRVRGPANLIKEIADRKIIVKAMVEIQANDTALTDAPRTVQFINVPKEVQIISPPVEVRVTVKPHHDGR